MGKFYWVFPLVLRMLLYFPVRWLFNIFLKFEVHGIENIQVNKTRGLVFVANHASELDPVLVNAALPFWGEHNPLFFAADEPRMFASTAVFGWRSYIYKGWFFKAWGAYPVYLKKHNFKEKLRHPIEWLQKNRSVLYFAEGRRTKDGILQKVKPGIGFLLHETGATMIPVGIKGSFGMSAKNFLLGRMRVSICFGAPIKSKDVWGDKVEINPNDFREGAANIMLQVKYLLQ